MFNFTLEDIEEKLSPEAAETLFNKTLTSEKHEYFLNTANVSHEAFSLAASFDMLPLEIKVEFIKKIHIAVYKEKIRQEAEDLKLMRLNSGNKKRGRA